MTSTRSDLRADPAGKATRFDVACYSIAANADPGVLPRVLELFAKRGLVPSRCHAHRDGPDGAELTIDIQIPDLTPEAAQYIARCLRRIYGVECVLTSRKAGEGEAAA